MEEPQSQIAIEVRSLSKTFKLPHEKYNSLKTVFINFYRRKKSYEMHRALKNVSLQINKGEFFGIVGRNGSGKSTLLKMLAGIYVPDKGEVIITGKLTPFIELGVGFNMELTGRENVYLNGALLGFSRKEMSAMYKDIVEFAELGPFMDQKLKNYSSGMQVRLAFSIAIRVQSDILLIDEVLAVGDAAFQQKCYDYFEQLKASGETVVFVSHDMNTVKRFCTRAALITQGKLDIVGSPEQVADLYEQQNASTAKLFDKESATIHNGAEISSLSIKGPKKKEYGLKDRLTIEMAIKADKPINATAGMNILKADGQLVAGITNRIQIGPQTFSPDKMMRYTFSFDTAQLAHGTFIIDGVLYDADDNHPIFFKPAMATFKTGGFGRGWGVINLDGKWENLTKD
jgi:ABC-2 type transport system ATP-binding protein